VSALAAANETDLSAEQFREISRTVYEISGIQLPAGKEGLVRSRLSKRLRAIGVTTYGQYLECVRDRRGAELKEMVDALTTNKTNFFREPAHFDFLRDKMLPGLEGGPLRIWSAGCSSGEEPYTLGMVLRDSMPDLARRDVKILATDISHRVLAQAKAGVYGDGPASDVAPDVLRRHFTRTPAGYEVSPAVRSLVTFASLNLMGKWPMRGPFQAIFCRNVMIYFDRPTQETLINRYYDLLQPGGYLFVGHSESLSALKHDFAYIQPAVYRK
jgi:chemotaxis protein methyltransferase CheR